METTKKVKRKLSIKGLIVVLLGIYLIIMAFLAFYKMPIKNIVVKGNNLLREEEIITTAGIASNESLWKVSSHKIKKNVESLDLISQAKVSKNLLGKITIDVTEEKVLFFYNNTQKYVLSNANEIEHAPIEGIPTLINFVASDILNPFIESLAKIDDSILKMISEIEYNPDIKDNITIDDGRFLLKMNDGNTVYINIVNLEKLNNYNKYVASLEDNAKGVMYLDSNFDGALFKTYDKIKEEQEKAEATEEPIEEKKKEEKTE